MRTFSNIDFGGSITFDNESLNDYIEEQGRLGKHPKPEFSFEIEGVYFMAIDKQIFTCSKAAFNIVKYFGGRMTIEHGGMVQIRKAEKLENQYRQIINCLDLVDTDQDERVIGSQLVKLLSEKGVHCQYNTQGVDLSIFSKDDEGDYSDTYKSLGCELKKKFPKNIEDMYSILLQVFGYMPKLKSCLLLNVKTSEYFKISELYKVNSPSSTVNLTNLISGSLIRVCRSCDLRFFIKGYEECLVPTCPVHELKKFKCDPLEVESIIIDSHYLVKEKNTTLPDNRYVDISDNNEWVKIVDGKVVPMILLDA